MEPAGPDVPSPTRRVGARDVAVARVTSGARNRTRRQAVVAIVLVAFAAASLGRGYAADRLRARAAAEVAKDPVSALRESRRALVLNPASLETHYLRAAAFARLGAAGLAEDTLRQAIEREPLNFVPWALLGDLQVRRGRIAQARRAYARARQLNPREPALRLLVADPRRALS